MKKATLSLRLDPLEKQKIDFLATTNNMTTKDYIIECSSRKVNAVVANKVALAQNLVALQYAIDHVKSKTLRKKYRKQVKKLWESLN